MWSTIGGDGNAQSVDGSVANSGFFGPRGLSLDADGNVYVADTLGNRIRMFTAATSTWSTIGGLDAAGFVEGSTAISQFDSPMAAAVGADGKVYVADYMNHRIRMFTPATSTVPLSSATSASDKSWI